MKILFKNGKELVYANGIAGTANYQNQNRKYVEIHFDFSSVKFDELLEIMKNPELTSEFRLMPSENELCFYQNYTILDTITLSKVIVKPRTETTEDVFGDRYIVRLYQKSKAELDLESLKSTVDTLLISTTEA